MTNEAKRILEDIISDFAPDKFIHFFRAKSRQFKELKENLPYYHDDDFTEGQKLGEIKFDGGDALVVCAFAAQKPLTERSGKKAQYDKAKKILKEQQIYTAGIFIFYDADGNFRFSLVYPEFTADKKIWSNFRRFTYFVSNEFTNKTFLKRIGDGDFAELSKIKESFSVEKVTREFYEDIANWYFWAIEHSRFPKDAEAEENGRNISIIRLITRIIFIWFMRERGLVPKALFEEKTIRDILHDTTAETSTFYKAVLQNLFFATLSTRKEARQFRSEVRGHKGYNSDFGNQYVYRYHDLFKNPDDIKTYFGNVPFLNGGLFECLDDKPNGLYIDGFTSVKKNQPEVPNFLFFSVETKADLNAVYGTKNKTYKVMGLLDILRSFNFTIDENSPDDQEVALDPELLGRVFENLLASFNPETATTARKATGSYYTPRGIVDYMVSESLKAYFKTHLSSIGHSERSEESLDERLNKLFSTSSDENPFSKAESEKIVGLVESVKIVDPAVGSGAFPMGALHKMVFILNKVDSGNVLWKQAQIRAAGGITDPAIRRDTIKRIEEFFRGKNADYGRKLYLIQRCIYGVDIQQIAVEIAKLRFFIALLVDEKIEPQKDNWGIEPLPNLDFKIMQGNSLISSFMGVDFDADTDKTGAKTQTGFDFADADDGLIKVFEQKKIDFQNEPGAEKKKQFKDEIEDLLIQIFETRMKMQKADYFQALEDIERRNAVMPSASRVELIAKEKEKLSKKTGFDLENIEKQLREFTGKKKTKPFFPWRLYFAEVFEKSGFDIVIGNPPWGQKSVKFSDEEIKYFKKTYPSATIGILDIFRLFIERGINLVNPKGSFAYVLPDIFLLKHYETTRKFVLDNLALSRIDHWGMAFDNVNLDSCTIIGSKSLMQNKENIVSCIIHLGKDVLHNNIEQSKFFQQEGYKFNLYLTDKLSNLINKLNQENKFGDYFEAHEGIHSGNIRDKLFLNKKINDNCKKLIFGRNEINKYYLSWNGKWVNYDKNIINKSLNEYAGLGKPEYFINHKIVVRRTGDFIMAALDENGFYFSNNVFVCMMKKSSNVNMKYTLGILNSKVATWFYRSIQPRKGKLFAELKINVLNTIPIKEASTLNQNKVIKLVDEIMINKKHNPKANVDELENEIDKLVFSIFMLSPEEIELINKSFT